MYQDILTIAVVTVFAFFAIYWMWFQGEVDGSRLIAKNSMKQQKFNIILVLVAAFIVKSDPCHKERRIQCGYYLFPLLVGDGIYRRALPFLRG